MQSALDVLPTCSKCTLSSASGTVQSMWQQARGKLPWACGTSRCMFEMITADIWSSLCLCRPVLQTPPPINCPILSKTLLQIYFISSPGRGEVGDCKEQKETCTNRFMPESTQTEGKDSHARRRCRVGSVLWNRLRGHRGFAHVPGPPKTV